MNKAPIESLLADLQTISGVRLRLIRSGTKHQFPEWSTEYPPVLVSFLYNSFQHLNISEHLLNGHICHSSNALGIERYYIPADDGSIVAIGPYSTVFLSTYEIDARLTECRLTPSRSLHHFFSNELPVIAAEKIESVKSILCAFMGIPAGQQELFLYQPEPKLTSSLLLSEKEKTEQEKLIFRYEHLQSISEAVSEGNFEKCMQILHDSFHYQITQHFSSDPLVNERLNFIQAGFLFYIACIKGGASPVEADQIYTQYLHDALQANTDKDVRKINTEMLQLLCALVQHSSSHTCTNLVQQLICYLSLHTNAPLDMEELCLAFHLPKSRLERLFKLECGTTINKYHRLLRLEKANKLLGNQNLTINQIAFQTGFIDQNYFSRVFKSHYHCTPNQMREKILTAG